MLLVNLILNDSELLEQLLERVYRLLENDFSCTHERS